MNDAAGLEQRYRRLLAWYPRAYRRANEQEILAVLLAGAGKGQRRPSVAEAADLIRGALWMRLSLGAVRPPRRVRGAVRLMLVGAAAELAAWISYLMTAGSVRVAMAHRDPAQWNTTDFHLVVVQLFGPLVFCLWLWLAWAIGRGRHWARGAFAIFFGTLTLGLLSQLAQGGAVYAPADVISTAVIWLIQLAVMVLLFSKQSASYYGRENAQG
jgi:hypothetical protein